MNSSSADEDMVNLTENHDELLNQNFNEIVDINENQDEMLDASSISNHKVSVQIKDYSNYTNQNGLKVKVNGYDSNDKYVDYVPKTVVTYKISDYYGKLVYSKTGTTNTDGTYTFDSNYNIFKTLGQGYYTCNLTTKVSKNPTTWNVGVPKGQLQITILTSQYTNCKNTYSLSTKVLFEPNRYLNSPKITYTIKNSNNVEIYKTTNQAVNGECAFDSNYNIFNNLREGVYNCELYVPNYIITGEGYFTGNTFKWSVLVNDNIIFTPPQLSSSPKTSIPLKTSNAKKNHYIKYVKVGKYKIKVWSDDSLNTQKNKVIKYLKKHVKKGHTFKKHGYKFKVSAKMYRKILYYKKYGFDGKVGYSNFIVKTNKFYNYKEPIYKTYKITKKVWVHKKVLSGWARWGDDWYDSQYYSLSKYFKNGWESYGYSDNEYSNGINHYTKLKKKVKKTFSIEKITGYKNVKLRVYAYGVESQLKVGVQFWGLKNGKKYAPITNYYMF